MCYNDTNKIKQEICMSNSIEKEYKKKILEQSGIIELLASLPDGYISEKSIYGTKQYYLQKRIGRRVVSRHITSWELNDIRCKLSERESLEKKLAEIEEQLRSIEEATRILNHNLYKRILLLKVCIPMEKLTVDEKVCASSFAEAMNAIEGVHATSETKANVNAWQSGEVSFLSIYEKTLIKYGFPVEVR